MKKANKQIVLALVLGMVACPLANGQRQTRFSPPTARAASGGSSGGDSGGGGYISGGERGSVVQVMRDAEVEAELNLSNEQQQQVSIILQRVKATEDELFEDSRRTEQERADSAEARSEQRMKKLEEARQHLAHASKKILEQLTPTQQAQLQAFCRQAKANEAAFQARMSSGPGGGGGGGGFGGGFSGGGGSGGGSFGGGGGSTSPGSGTTWRNEHRSEYSSGGGPGGVVRVISYDRIQEQLRLSPEQRLQIGEIIGEVSQMEADLFAELQPPRHEPGNEWFKQRRQKVESTRQAVARAGEEILQQMTPTQQTRLKEICLQAQGADALFKPEIIQALGLTATQQIKLAAQRQEAERQSAALFHRDLNTRPAPSPINSTPLQERLTAIQRDTGNRMITSVLTPAQQGKLKQMQGKEFAGAARLMTAGATASSSAGTWSSSDEQLRRR